MAVHGPWSHGKCVQLFFLFCEKLFDRSLKWTCKFRKLQLLFSIYYHLAHRWFFLFSFFFVEILLTSADSTTTTMSRWHLTRSATTWMMMPNTQLPTWSCQVATRHCRTTATNDSTTSRCSDVTTATNDSTTSRWRMRREMEGSGDENGPKRRVWCRRRVVWAIGMFFF